jgi:hypothetical protein
MEVIISNTFVDSHNPNQNLKIIDVVSAKSEFLMNIQVEIEKLKHKFNIIPSEDNPNPPELRLGTSDILSIANKSIAVKDKRDLTVGDALLLCCEYKFQANSYEKKPEDRRDKQITKSRIRRKLMSGKDKIDLDKPELNLLEEIICDMPNLSEDVRDQLLLIVVDVKQ